MDNKITVTLKELETGEHDYHMDFESSPTLSELCAVYLIIKMVLQNNFDDRLIFSQCATIYDRIADVEEVYRIP